MRRPGPPRRSLRTTPPAPVRAPLPGPFAAPRLVGVWWLSPPVATLVVLPPTLLLALLVGAGRYEALWGTDKALDGVLALQLSAGVLALVTGALAAQVLPDRPRRTPVGPWPADQQRVLDRAADLLWAGTLVGYVLLLLVGLSRGVTLGQLLAALRDADVYTAGLKESFAPVAGLTTLTQLGPAFAVVAMLQLRRAPDPVARRRLVVVLVLGALRGYLLSERLALLELVVPLAVLLAVRGAGHPRATLRRLARIAPLLLAPLVVAVFSLFEYSRSWQVYARTSDRPFTTFVLERFAGYYATAYNNGALALEHARYPGRLPYGTAEALWSAPGVEQVGLYARLTGVDPLLAHDELLRRHGNPEFTNPGGLVTPFVDGGILGGLLFLLVAGALLGLAYRSLRVGRPTGLLLYPVLVTGLFELPRYVYWTQGRVLPTLVALGLLAWRLERRAPLRRQRLRLPAPPVPAQVR